MMLTKPGAQCGLGASLAQVKSKCEKRAIKVASNAPHGRRGRALCGVALLRRPVLRRRGS